jgi:type IV secretion system protein VirB8
MKNEWRWDNPLGFQVIEYRRDQETVVPIAAAGMATPSDGSGGAPASGEAH